MRSRVNGTRAATDFAGDTALHPHVDEIRERYAPTTAILPVDGTRFRAGQQWVPDPEQAAAVAARLGVRTVMPTHHELRYTDPVLHVLLAEQSRPIGRLRAALARHAPEARLIAPSRGETVTLA